MTSLLRGIQCSGLDENCAFFLILKSTLKRTPLIYFVSKLGFKSTRQLCAFPRLIIVTLMLGI